MKLTKFGLAAGWTLGLILVGLSLAGGCSMCCGPYDFHYPSMGGVVERSDPEYGRVGSILSDPWNAGAGPSADSNLPSRSNERSVTAQASSHRPAATRAPHAPVPTAQPNMDELDAWSFDEIESTGTTANPMRPTTGRR